MSITISFAELKTIAHYSDSYWELADLQERMEALCAPELARYNISFNGFLGATGSYAGF